VITDGFYQIAMGETWLFFEVPMHNATGAINASDGMKLLRLRARRDGLNTERDEETKDAITSGRKWRQRQRKH